MATKSRKPRPFRWTRSHLARLPDDGNRYEVLNGELLVTPQARPSHQVVAMRIGAAFLAYCDEHKLGTVAGPGAVVWKKNELQPDVMVIPGVTRIAPDAKWTDFPLAAIVVEILSDGSERHDRYKKRDAYLALGIRNYWIVDIDEREVQVWTPGAEEPLTVKDAVTWRPSESLQPLTIDLARLFGE